MQKKLILLSYSYQLCLSVLQGLLSTATIRIFPKLLFSMAIFAFLDANANSEKNNIPRTTKLFQVYTPSDYSLGPQNRAILQHSNGLIYVGNNDGLLEFDGIEWRKYSIPDYNVWSIGEDSRGRLYIGGSNGRIG